MDPLPKKRLFLKKIINFRSKIATPLFYLFFAFFLGIIIFITTSKENSKREVKLLTKEKNKIVLTSFKPFVVQGEEKRELPPLSLIQNQSLFPVAPPITVTPQVLGTLINSEEVQEIKERKEIIKYIVKPGDTLSGIAENFNLSLNTLLWSNDLNKNSTIKPGQELTILPVDGLIHIVKKGDTLESIAKMYKADVGKIADINEIISPDEIFENQALIIPDGKMPSSPERESNYKGLLSTNDFYGLSHHYPYGQCTYWVAQKRRIPAWGNARDWLDNAIASGYPVCKGSYCKPQVGAVISLKGSKLGHVAYVEEVKGDRVIFSEMNYIGLGKVNYRSLKVGDPRILGYIYKLSK